jgi:hypothetical protein
VLQQNGLDAERDHVFGIRSRLDENLVFIESMMVQTDAPADLIAGGHASADLDYGPRGPQHLDGAQIG